MGLSHGLYQHLSKDWKAQVEVTEMFCRLSPAKRRSTLQIPHLAPQKPQQLEKEDTPRRIPLPLQ